MSTTIALAGKGGVGKTTTAALIIKYLIQAQNGAVMAIDADPSSNLNMALGLELDWTVGDIREGLLTEVKKSLTAGGAAMGVMPGGATKRDYLDYQIRSSVAEGDQVDSVPGADGRAHAGRHDTVVGGGLVRDDGSAGESADRRARARAPTRPRLHRGARQRWCG